MKSTPKISKKQRKIFDYISQCIDERGYPPSIREIGEFMGLKSPSTVHLHLNSLERAGMISRSPGKTRAITITAPPDPTGVPVLGTVAAGEPILAVEDALGYIPYEVDNENGDYFALKIRGDSMIDVGILDGDMVIVRRQSSADSGDIVVAMLEDEATCKRLYKRGHEVWLIPENQDYDPIDGILATILGKVTAVIRTY